MQQLVFRCIWWTLVNHDFGICFSSFRIFSSLTGFWLTHHISTMTSMSMILGFRYQWGQWNRPPSAGAMGYDASFHTWWKFSEIFRCFTGLVVLFRAVWKYEYIHNYIYMYLYSHPIFLGEDKMLFVSAYVGNLKLPPFWSSQELSLSSPFCRLRHHIPGRMPRCLECSAVVCQVFWSSKSTWCNSPKVGKIHQSTFQVVYGTGDGFVPLHLLQ